jgi:hypothetical protein
MPFPEDAEEGAEEGALPPKSPDGKRLVRAFRRVQSAGQIGGSRPVSPRLHEVDPDTYRMVRLMILSVHGGVYREQWPRMA